MSCAGPPPLSQRSVALAGTTERPRQFPAPALSRLHEPRFRVRYAARRFLSLGTERLGFLPNSRRTPSLVETSAPGGRLCARTTMAMRYPAPSAAPVKKHFRGAPPRKKREFRRRNVTRSAFSG